MTDPLQVTTLSDAHLQAPGSFREKTMPNIEFREDSVTDHAKREVLLEAYRTHATLLHNLTQIDVRIFTGFITIQLISIGFILSKSIDAASKIQISGIAIADFALCYISAAILWRNYQRRSEAGKTINRINIALGLKQKGFYISNIHIIHHNSENLSDHATPPIRPWMYYYIIGIIAGGVGFLLVLSQLWPHTPSDQVKFPTEIQSPSHK